MEEDGYSDGEAGLYPQGASVQLFRQNDSRTRGMLLLTAATALLFTAAAVALLVVLGGRGSEPPHSQTTNQLNSRSPGSGNEQQQLAENPSTLLTAPNGNNTDGIYLQWESKLGNTHCRGGFNYSRGNIVVPIKGMYRVFLQITYDRKSGKECNGNEELKLSNSVLYSSDSYPASLTLLAAVDTVSCRMKTWTKSLYTSGSFSLEANSRLRVTSTHTELIVNAESQVFFGVELLSQITESTS